MNVPKFRNNRLTARGASFSMFHRIVMYSRADRGVGLDSLARIQIGSGRVGSHPNAADAE